MEQMLEDGYGEGAKNLSVCSRTSCLLFRATECVGLSSIMNSLHFAA